MDWHWHLDLDLLYCGGRLGMARRVFHLRCNESRFVVVAVVVVGRQDYYCMQTQKQHFVVEDKALHLENMLAMAGNLAGGKDFEGSLVAADVVAPD
jgi:hypothetical protein